MECPVCKTITSDPDQKKCPECGADLEIFLLLETLEKQAHKKKKNIAIMGVLLVLIITAAAAFYYFFFDLHSMKSQADAIIISRQQTEIQHLNEEKQLLAASITELRSEVQNLTGKLETLEKKQVQSEKKESKPAFREIYHVVKPGESLQRIAKKYYGNADEYVRIMKDNNLKNANSIRINQRLKIIVPETE